MEKGYIVTKERILEKKRIFEYLLEKEDILLLSILKTFVAEQEMLFSYKRLNEKFNISQPTLKKYLNRIQQLLEELEIGKLEMHSKSARFVPSDNFTMSLFISRLIENAPVFHLIETIFWGQWTSLESFSLMLGISRQGLQTRIRQTKELLEQFNLSLNLSSNQMIIGDEHQIRAFFFSIFMDLDYSYFEKHGKISSERVFDILNKFARKSDYFNIYPMYVWMVILKERISQGYITNHEEDDEIFEPLSFYDEQIFSYKNFYRILEQFDLFRNLSIFQKRAEAKGSYLFLMAICLIDFNSGKNVSILSSEIDPLTKKMFLEVSNQLPFRMTNDEINYILMNLTILHTVAKEVIVDTRYAGIDHIIQKNAELFPREHLFHRELIEKVAENNPDIKEYIRRMPAIESVYYALLQFAFNNHRRPLTVWVKCRCFTVEKQQIKNLICSVPEVHTTDIWEQTSGNFDYDCVITNWIHDEDELKPTLHLCMQHTNNVFEKIRKFLCEQVDMKF